MSVTVVGSGVVGLTIATELAERGVDVEIIEQAPSRGNNACSWFAGGMLAPWCEGDTAEEPVVRLGQQSISWWEHHIGEITKRGSIVLVPPRDMPELSRFARRTQEHTTIDKQQLSQLEPDLADKFSKALFFEKEAHIDPRQALEILEENLAKRRVKIQYGKTLNTHKPKEIIVDARGFASKDSLKDLRGVKGEMLIIKSRDINLTRPIRLIHPRFPVYIVSRGKVRDGYVYMVGATQYESEQRGAITARGMVDLLNAVYAIHPAFAEAEILETGADVRPAFADNLPRLRWNGNTLYVNGLFRHGFLLAPACAHMAAESILDRNFKPEFMDEDYRQQSTS